MKKMSKAKTARELALDVLMKVEQEKAYSNLQLNQELKKFQLSRADVSFATEIIYGSIQRQKTLDWIINQYIKKKISSLEPWVRSLLRLSLYQIYYLDKVPAHAVVNEAVNIANIRGHKGISGFVNGVLRNILRNLDSISIPADLADYQRIALQHSHPEWMVKRFIASYGSDTAEAICQANNLAPYHSIRVNLLKTTREELISLLQESLGEVGEITPSPLSKQGIRIKGGGNLALSDLHKLGYFTIQDESSMLVADVLDPQPEMVVLDAAAAPGGKTTHLAEKMGNKGRIIAVDLHQHKIKLIEAQSKRLGLSIIETVTADARIINQQYGQIFDRILLDAPCSGLGVIRRKPDLKWSKIAEDIASLVKIQQELLNAVAPLLKKGGVLVYSTCTLTNEENQQIVNNFVAKNSGFRLDQSLEAFLPEVVTKKITTTGGMIQLLPQHFQTDGFFISRIIRTE